MSRPPCNKCKSTECCEGDSWCKGCSALELSQTLLKQKWAQVGIRKTEDQVLLSGCRLVKALRWIVDSRVRDSPDRVPHPRAVPPRSRSPRRARPPLPRAPTPPPARSPLRRNERHQERDRREPSEGRDRDRRRERQRSPEEDTETFEEESEDHLHKVQQERTNIENLHDVPKEIERKKKKGKRGGTRHQRQYR